jgi:hypothetical protein
MSPSLGAAGYQQKGMWNVAASHRWQYSDRHFVGDVDQVYRTQEGSQVINDVHVVDFAVSYAVTKRISATLSIPFQTATRSQAIRDTRRVGGASSPLVNPSPFPNPETGVAGGAVIDRFETQASGLGDMKLLASAWLLDPETSKKQNISVGLGVLFPTGEKDSKDSFSVFATNAAGAYQPRSEIRNVDNSIQPGAGAWGLILDVSAFREIIPDLVAFAAFTYISTPEEDAGVWDGPNNTGRIWSVGDAYLARLGFGYTFLPKYGLTFTLGGRIEGSPSSDLIGGSGGRRRPGYGVSIEPGLVFAKNNWTVSFTAPVALYRNREPDATGASGDAAFADFMTLLSVGRKF